MAMEIDTFTKRLEKAFIETFDPKVAAFGHNFSTEEDKSVTINVYVTDTTNNNAIMVDYTINRKTYGELFPIALRYMKAWKGLTRMSAKKRAKLNAEATEEE